MTFQQILHYLEKLGEFNIHLGLQPTQNLLALLAQPKKTFKSILVGGTNGKGSVCSYLTSIATAAHIKVGTYLSPHLISPTERIAINGKSLGKDEFTQYAKDLQFILKKYGLPNLTYFEFLTCMAFHCFQEENVELAIFEVGLGGRLDSTNAIERIGTIITTIDYDHMNILGNSLVEISSEKAAILRKKLPAVISQQHPIVLKNIHQHNQQVNAHLIQDGVDYQCFGNDRDFLFTNKNQTIGPVSLGLRGKHQIANAGCATAMALELCSNELSINANHIEMGLRNTWLPARLEPWCHLETKTEIWIDVAHNASAAKSAAEYFMQQNIAPFDIVIGMLRTKDYKTVLSNFMSIAKSFTLCKPNSLLAWDPEHAKTLINNIPCEVVECPHTALQQVVMKSTRILCTGSFYIMEPIYQYLTENQFQLGMRPGLLPLF